MATDLRGLVISGLQKLGYGSLSMLGQVSAAFLDERRQLQEQQGPIKITFVMCYMGSKLNQIVGVATKYVKDRIVMQRLSLSGDGTLYNYNFFTQRGYGTLILNQATHSKVTPESAVDLLLAEAYS